MADTSIIQQARDFVTKKFAESEKPYLTFHNMEHTRRVAEAAAEIAEHSGVSEQEKEILQLAAWFHDIGYIVQGQLHEEIGRRVATKFLRNRNYPEDAIAKVGGCIIATRMPQEPKNKLEEIMCDADMLHLARPDYLARISKLRKEWNFRHQWNFEDHEWLRKNQEFLSRHEFFTDYARQHYSEAVERNKRLVDDSLRDENR